MSAFVAWHPIYRLQLPEGHRFPMEKYELLHDQLIHWGIAKEKDFFEPEIADLSLLEEVHSVEYVQKIVDLKLSYKEERRMGFPQSEELIERELRLITGTIEGAKIALKNGFAFQTAGGTHHAGRDFAEGFCIFNDQAAAAHFLIKNKLAEKVLILDLDVHQGNGTADIFKNRPEVFTFSMHCQNNFPFEKISSDLDVGLPDKIGGKEYLIQLEESLNKVSDLFQPDFIFYQAGVDVLATDRMGRLNLSPEDCRQRDRMVFEFCKDLGIPVQVSMGGGYSRDITQIVDAHCQTYEEGMEIMMN